MDDQTKALLQEPDAVLMSRGRELDEFLGHFTVPLFFFQGEPQPETLREVGSGVLTKIGAKSFILTAGHCVDAVRSHSHVGVGISRAQHRFLPRFWSMGRAAEGDYGYLELHPEDASWVTTKGRAFMSPGRIDPVTAADLRSANDWMIVSGFPRKLQVWVENPATGEYGHRVQQLHASTSIAGVGGAPSPTWEQPAGIEVIDVWLPEKGNLDTVTGRFTEIDVPQFGGISGGGYWKAGVRPDPSGWTESRLKLVGIHIGSEYGAIHGGETYRFSRAVLVHHHLRLIAREHPDIAPEMSHLWPGLLS